jgi:(2R)-sulfolactate sulfo-lyase subunit beta
VLDKAETPTGPGLWFMDSSSAAAEMVTLCGGCRIRGALLPTGQGNVIGNPILPVIKLCANPAHRADDVRARRRRCLGAAAKEMTPDQAGDKLLECMFRTATAADSGEALGHREFVLTRLYESA